MNHPSPCCEDWAQALSLLAAEALEPDEQTAVRQHLAACPACREPTLYTPGNPFRPFCSARCQGQDFGAWATESYRVGADSPPDTADD